MAANVENMFYVRETPWHGLGTKVEEAVASEEALRIAGLNWAVNQRPIYTANSVLVPNYKANIRESDDKVLGVVTDRYAVVQNQDAFAFTDSLLGKGVKYETAGSLKEGRKVWLLARLPEKYKILDDEIESYLVFANSHDGSGSIKVAVTPVRVVCQNTLNLALNSARRMWSAIHAGDINQKLDEAHKTLMLSELYMKKFAMEAEKLNRISLSDSKVKDFINELIPLDSDISATRQRNIESLRNDMVLRYFEAPDLIELPKTGWRFLNAISDFATHTEPLRKTRNYRENLFTRTVDGHPIIDKAYDMVKAAA